MICEIDGLVLGGMQFGAGVGAVLGGDGALVFLHFCILTVGRRRECSLVCWC